MLPIKRKHYNYLTGQFEDECENHFNLLPTTSYPNFVSETNEHDVKIERIAVKRTEINRKYDWKIAKEYTNAKAIETLGQVLISDPYTSETGINISDDSDGFFSWLFPKGRKITAWRKRR